MKMIWVLCLLMFSFTARAQLVEYSTEILQLDPEVRVESLTRDGVDLEVVHLGNGQRVEIPVDAALKEGLKPEEFESARENARLVYEGLVRALASNEFNGTMTIGQDSTAVVLGSTVDGVKVKRFSWFRGWLRQRLTTGVMAMDPSLMKSVPQGLSVDQKFVRFLRVAWQFVLVETVHAGVDYWDRFWSAPKLVEFGLSVDVKVEPQIFIGKFNPTQKVRALRNSYALGLEVSFDKSRKRFSIRSRLRREKGSGGLGMPAAKLEFKLFQTDGTHSVQGGQSWYPISPPVASFVLDRDFGGHYFAQGITFGVNSGDLIPGSTLTNTFATYAQKENAVDLRTIPQTVERAFDHAVNKALTPVRAPTCSALFTAM